MSKKKQIITLSFLIAISIAIVLIALLVPAVHIVGHAADDEKTKVYDQAVSLIQYLKDEPFMTTAAFDVYFSATGPIWMATGALLCNLLIAIGGIALFVACVYELASIAKPNWATKNNVLTKKIAIIVAILSLLLSIFAIISYSITTLLSKGYADFYFDVGPFIMIVVSIGVLYIAKMLTPRVQPQETNKLKNIIGFSLTTLFTAIILSFMFLPIFSSQAELVVGPGRTSLYGLTQYAEEYMTIPAALSAYLDYPFGFMRYAIFITLFVGAFCFIYSIIGLILSCLGKKTDWLSSRIKRWSMTMIVIQTIMLFLLMCCFAVLESSFYNAEFNINILGILTYVLMFMPYMLYAASTLVSLNKKPGKQKDDKQSKEGWLEPNTVPNDVVSPTGEQTPEEPQVDNTSQDIIQ